MSALKIRKVGNSLGVLFTKEIQEILNISEGDMIDITALKDNQVILTSHLPHHSQWTFKDTELNDEDLLWINAELGEDDES